MSDQDGGELLSSRNVRDSLVDERLAGSVESRSSPAGESQSQHSDRIKTETVRDSLIGDENPRFL